MKDVGFLDTNMKGVHEVPFAVTGVASGAAALLQQVMILTFVSPKDPARYVGGGFIRDYRASNITVNNIDQLRNLLTIAISDVKKTVLAAQARQTGLTDDEKLADITINTLAMPDQSSMNIVLDVITISGQTASAALNTGSLP